MDRLGSTSPRAVSVSRILALALLIATLLTLGGVLVLNASACSSVIGGFSLFEAILITGSALGFALLGALIVFNQPDNRIGWLSSAIGFTFLFAYLSSYSANCGIAGMLATPGTAWMAWLGYTAFPATVVLLFGLLPSLFPDGRFVTPAWRRLTEFVTGAVLASLAVTALIQGPLIYSSTDSNYKGF